MTDMTALQKNDLKSFINQKDATGVFKKEGIEGEARRKEKKGKKKKKEERRDLCALQKSQVTTASGESQQRQHWAKFLVNQGCVAQ